MATPFDWETDCGREVTPADAVRECRARSITFEQYAEEYRAAWPFDEAPPADLVAGMVRDMEQAAHAAC